jgi:hypothetical protein
MKKILVAVMAVMMTMGLMAQCPQQKTTCNASQEGKCEVKKECVKADCVYSPETRAMMQVDRLARVVKDLTGKERQELVDFYVSHFVKFEKRKESANPMTREECKAECNAALRKVLGDDRYIQYLENCPAKSLNCEMRRAPQHIKGCHNGHARCPKAGEKGCPRK